VNCQEARVLLHGYLDRELDLGHSLEVEQHLRECPSCAGVLAGAQALRTALRAGPPPAALPPGLEQRLHAALRRAAGGDRPARRRVWLRLAAAAVLLLAVGATAVSLLLRPSAQERQAEEVVTNHLRSLLDTNYLLAVSSSDRHKVKPWFAGRLGFTFPVPDLAERDFLLKGGRLDYLDHRLVAALVYQRKDHVINVFIAPAVSGDPAGPAFFIRQGYQLAHWRQGDLTYWAISDLEPETFRQFVEAFRQT
jgi:anti-sigma factor RsiW